LKVQTIVPWTWYYRLSPDVARAFVELANTPIGQGMILAI